jgi:hypothetical protein
MAVTLQELLLPTVILDLISRVRPGQGQLGRWLGFQPNRFNPEDVTLSGPATESGKTRNATVRIFNATRVPSTFRAPATAPDVIVRNPVATFQVACARMHSKIPLNCEELGNLSPMIGPNSQIDPNGQSYVRAQTNYIATRFGHGVEMLSAGMIRDSMYLIQSGEQWVPSFTAPTSSQVGFQITFQIPSGNKNQLNMLGTGNIITVSWANVGADILGNLMSIKAAFTQLTGYTMQDIWINSIMWGNILKNTGIRNTGGSANTVYAEYRFENDTGMDGEPNGGYYGVLRADPTVRWHINDQILALGGNQLDPIISYSTAVANKVIPDNMAIFCTPPNPEVCKMYQGAEPVIENPGMPMTMRSGYYFWHELTTQPSSVDLIGLLNCLPVLNNPYVFAPATVTGF